MSVFRSILDPRRGSWSASSVNQRAVVSIVIVATLVSAGVFFAWLRHDSMVVLYSRLEPQQAASVVDHVREQGLRVEVRNGGQTVLVPLREVDRLRMELALEGIGGDGVRGWDLFDDRVVGETNFGRSVRLKRAIEGELARSIASIAQVERARVHLSMPKESVVPRDRTVPTASVLLSLRGRPDAAQIEGVQRLVSSAVESLTPDRVSVVDASSGHVLSGASVSGPAGASDAQLRLRKGVEEYLAGKASDLLADVLGPGRFVVRVNADLDFAQLERSTESYDPQTVVRSEQTDQVSGGKSSGGPTTTITNYEVPRTVETVLKNGSILQRLSVAVAVDGAHPTQQGATGITTPRSAAELAQIERMVANAVGVVAERGDVIDVVNMPFETPPLDEGSPAGWMDHPWAQQALLWIGRLLMMLVAGLVLVLVTRTLVRAWPPPDAPRATGPTAPGATGTASEQLRGVAEWAQSEPDAMADVLRAFATRED